MPPPREYSGAPQKACHPASRALAPMTHWAVAVTRVSVSNNTSALRSMIVCQCSRTEVVLASAARESPGCGCYIPIAHQNPQKGPERPVVPPCPTQGPVMPQRGKTLGGSV